MQDVDAADAGYPSYEWSFSGRPSQNVTELLRLGRTCRALRQLLLSRSSFSPWQTSHLSLRSGANLLDDLLPPHFFLWDADIGDTCLRVNVSVSARLSVLKSHLASAVWQQYYSLLAQRVHCDHQLNPAQAATGVQLYTSWTRAAHRRLLQSLPSSHLSFLYGDLVLLPLPQLRQLVWVVEEFDRWHPSSSCIAAALRYIPSCRHLAILQPPTQLASNPSHCVPVPLILHRLPTCALSPSSTPTFCSRTSARWR